QLVVGNIAAVAPYVSNGRLRALAVTSKTRSPLLPEVPTVAESGLPGFENTGWFGFMVPAGTPQAIVDKIHRDTVKALGSTEMKARLFVAGMSPVGNAPADFAKAIDKESAHWAKVVERRKLKANRLEAGSGRGRGGRQGTLHPSTEGPAAGHQGRFRAAGRRRNRPHGQGRARDDGDQHRGGRGHEQPAVPGHRCADLQRDRRPRCRVRRLRAQAGDPQGLRACDARASAAIV